MIEGIRRRLDDVHKVDHAVARWIGQRPPSPLDAVLKGLGTAANHGTLWFAIAAARAVRKGATRR
ncbi:MAG: glycerophosphatase, partial [Pseudonocardiaceae bacterium]